MAACLLFPVTAWGWEPGPAAPVGTGGFAVDRFNRSDVVSFWHAIYQASEGYHDRAGWTGNHSSTAAGAEGENSAAFVDDVERRINFFRAMVGVPATAVVNSGSLALVGGGDAHQPVPVPAKSAAAQRSALMISRTRAAGSLDALSHDPPATCVGWTPAAWNANKNGNLAQNFYGPGAIDAYIRESAAGISSWNQQVGHRRLILARDSTDFATGDTPGAWLSNTFFVPSNCLYVNQRPEELVPRPAGFAAYPNDGYFPAVLNSRYWSLSYPGASFSSAAVAMSDAAGNAVPVTIQSRGAPYGERTLVWAVPESVAVNSVAADTTYHVTVTGIQGPDVPSSKSYSVTLIDPWFHDSPALEGPLEIPTTGAAYYFVPSTADSLRFRVATPTPTTGYLQGAEDSPVAAVVDGTSPGYPLRSAIAGHVRTGAKAFRLTFDRFLNPSLPDVDGALLPDEQKMELVDEFVPGAGGQLQFFYRRGLMSAQTFLAPEYSADYGRSWLPLGAVIAGKATGSGDSNFGSLQSRAFPAETHGKPLKVRFRLYWSKNVTTGYFSREQFPDPAYTTGIFLDDIALAGCQRLVDSPVIRPVDPSAKRVRFEPLPGEAPPLPGAVRWLRLEPRLGGRWFPAPPKVVTFALTPATGFDAWRSYEFPELKGDFETDHDGDGVADGIEYSLGLNPLDGRSVATCSILASGNSMMLSLELSSPRPDVNYTAQWSENLSTWQDSPLPAVHAANRFQASIPGGRTRFARWKMTRK